MADNNSKILLCKNIKVDREYKNVLSYSESDMLALCQNSNNLIDSDLHYSFIRATGEIQTDFDYDDCLQANYIAFQNSDYSNKWFFAWIDEVTYNGELNTLIKYTVDEWSTWFNKLTKKACHVVREHVNDDTIGLHTTDEGIGIEDYVCESEEDVLALNTEGSAQHIDQFGLWICVFSTWDIEDEEGFTGAIEFNKNIFGNNIYCFELSEDGVYDLENFLYITNKQGHISDVHDMFIIPKAIIMNNSNVLFTKTVTYGLTEVTTHYKKVRYDNNLSDVIRTIGKYITPLHTFSDFVPKNNKLFVYPFNYLMVTNNLGSQNIYKYEDFVLNEDNECKFTVELALSIGGSGRLVPQNYKGIENNIDESLTLAKYPTCSWASDSYINWLTNNAVDIAQSVIGIGARYCNRRGDSSFKC